VSLLAMAACQTPNSRSRTKSPDSFRGPGFQDQKIAAFGGSYSDRAGAAEGGDLFDLPVMGSQPVITNVSNTFCPSRAACRTSRNVSSSRTFGLAGFRAGVVFMLAGMRD